MPFIFLFQTKFKQNKKNNKYRCFLPSLMHYLIRYAEIALKGKNRQAFENQLVKNLKEFLKTKREKAIVKRIQGRLLIEAQPGLNFKPVFGITSFSPCLKVNAELKSICEAALSIVYEKEKCSKTTSFRVSSIRSTKNFPITSPQLNEKIGAFLVQKTGLKVNLGHPDLNVGVEVIGESAYVYDSVIQCFGGLPVGIEGKVLVLLLNKNALLAGLLMAKRGCSLELVAYESADVLDYSLLQRFSPSLLFHAIKTSSELDGLAQKRNCKAIVVPDLLVNLNNYSFKTLVLRPLITFSEQEVLAELDKYSSL